MIMLLINLIIIGLILAIIWWAITQIPMLAPFMWVVRAIFALVVAIVLINFLLGGMGSGIENWHFGRFC